MFQRFCVFCQSKKQRFNWVWEDWFLELLITTKTISRVRSLAPRMWKNVVSSGAGVVALSKSMEQSLHGETNNFSDSHETPLPQPFFWGGGNGNEGTWSCSKEHVTCAWPETDKSSPCPPILFFKPNISVILQLMLGSSNCSHFFRFSHQNLLRISLLPLMFHIPVSSA